MFHNDAERQDRRALVKVFAVVALCVAGALVAIDVVSERHQQAKTKALLTPSAKMLQAVNMGQSTISDSGTHIFWLEKEQNGGTTTLQGQFSAQRNMICFGEMRAPAPSECTEFADKPIEYFIDAMNAACITARREHNRDYLKKFCSVEMV